MQLGEKIRSLRHSKSISIQQLAQMTGLSMGLISKIERDLVATSVTAIWKIGQALEVPIGYFFDEVPKEGPVLRKNKRKKITLAKSNKTYEMLSPDLKRKMEVILVNIEPGECPNIELISHEGEECGFVITGKIKVVYGNEEYFLEEGDSIYFDSTVPHAYLNIGSATAVSIWSMTPPSY